ncbi:MAG TPA: SurA N-terminal domain-containing protein [Burkholderiales bacterium]|nr:SurA N-terminal domain-containing protein [Burkholderiales bacterium]
MFDFVAKHKRILQIVLGLTIVPFAFFGLESYTRSIGGANQVASVNGTPISTREYAEALRQQQDRLRQMLGGGADVAAFDTPEIRLAILESVIAQRLVMGEVADARLAVPKEEVVAAILAAPEFQEGGKFSSERYMAYLRSRSLTDEGNVEALRIEIPASRLASAIASTAFQPRALGERLLALQNEQREVEEAFIAAEQFLPQVKLDEARVKAYYEANLAEFKVPERVRVEYLVLSAEELAKNETPTDAELKGLYDSRASQLGAAEQRRASHILLKTRAEAEKVLAEARKAPQQFAELAKKYSQDAGSAQNGGDLGMNAKGGLASPALEEAIFKLKPGEISDVVQSEFGFHVIRLVSIQPGKSASFEELKKDLAAEIGKQKGAKKFAESADAFNNLVYEQSDSLKPAAERYKLQPQTSGWLTRQPSPGQGMLGNPKLLAAIFSSDAIQQHRNTDAVEVAPGVLVAAHVVEHEPEKTRPLEEVKAEVDRRLALREALVLARKEGDEKLAVLNKGGDAGLQWGAAKTVSRREAQGLAPEALRQVMTANASKLPAYAGMERGETGYAIFRISKLIAAEPKSGPDSAAEMAALDRQSGADQLSAYVASLRARAKVEINRANLEKK